MPKLPLGEEGLSIESSVAQMERGGRAMGQLGEKVSDLESRQKSLAGAEEASAAVREDLAKATRDLAQAIEHGGSVLATETSEWDASNAALRENLRLRRELSQVVTRGGTAPSVVEPTVAPARPAAVAPTPVVATAAPVAAPPPRVDPAAQRQLGEAQTALREAETRQTALAGELAAARTAYASSVGQRATEVPVARERSLVGSSWERRQAFELLGGGAGGEQPLTAAQLRQLRAAQETGMRLSRSRAPEETLRARGLVDVQTEGSARRLRPTERGAQLLANLDRAIAAEEARQTRPAQVAQGTARPAQEYMDALQRQVAAVNADVQVQRQNVAEAEKQLAANRALTEAKARQATVAVAGQITPTIAPEGPATRLDAARLEAERARQAYQGGQRQRLPPDQLAVLQSQRDAANEELTAARSEARARSRVTVAEAANVTAIEEATVATTRNIAGMRGATPYVTPPAGPRNVAGMYGEAGGTLSSEGTIAEIEALRASEARVAWQAVPTAPPGVGAPPPGAAFGGGGRPPSPPPPAPPGGPPPEGPGGAGRAQSLAGEGTALENLAARQAAVNREVMQSGVAYAESSNALSRHGALTTEFIQALARGDVTLREFSSQMVSTIGKFGGWLVAGAAIYGVVGLFEDMKKGAEDTQNAVTNLGRWIPGLGGPAGGGSGQTSNAEGLLRQIATQFNEPIGAVGDSMQVVARVFHNLGEAGEATRAVLAVSKLDQVPVAQATQYLLGISQSMGWTSSRPLTGVVDTLNELQNRVNARVQQTLPAVARAAPAALAGGVDIQHVEALSALGVAAGIQGPVVGTALARALGGYIFRPSSQEFFASRGIRPSDTSAQGIIDAVFANISKRAEEGRPLPQQELRAYANALTTNVVASRTILPILEQAQSHPERYQQALEAGYHPQTYQRDLDQLLSSMSERFKSIGISLQTFGSELASAGVLTPLTTGLTVLHTFVGALQTAVGPVAGVSRALGDLASPLRDLAILLVAAGAAALAYRRTFLGSTAENFIGRLATGSEWEQSPRQIVRQRLAETRNILLPEAQRQQEQARGGVMQALIREQSAAAAQAEFERGAERQGLRQPGAEFGTAAPGTGERGERYALESEAAAAATARASRGVASARERELAATTRVVQLEADRAVLSGQEVDAEGKRLSWAQKSQYAEQRGLVAEDQYANLAEEVNAETRRRIALLGGQTAAAGAPPIAGGATGTLAGTTAPSAAAAVAMGTALAAAPWQRIADGLETVGNQPTTFLPNEQRNYGLGGGWLPGTPGERPQRFAAAGMGAPPPTAGQAVTPGQVEADEQVRTFGQRMTQQSIAQATSMAGMLAPALGRVQQAMGQSALVQGIANRISGVNPEQLQQWGQRVMPFVPFAGLMATSYLGQQIGGGAGQAISNVGGSVFTGALIAQMFGGGLKPMAGAATVANLAGAYGQGGLAGAGITAGTTAIGAGIGAVVGGGAPGALVGSFIGSTVGNLATNLLGIGKDTTTPSDIKRQASQIENSINTVGAQYQDALTQMFSQTGSAASNAGAKVQQIMQDMQARMLLFGSQSTAGRQAGQDLQRILQSAADTMDTDPTAAQSTIQGVMTATNQAVARSTALLKYADPSQVGSIVKEGMSQLKFTPLTSQGASEKDLEDLSARQGREIAKQQERVAQARARGQFRQAQAPVVDRGPVSGRFGFIPGVSGSYETVQEYTGPGGGAADPQRVLDQLKRQKADVDRRLGNLKSVNDLLNALYKDAQQQLVAQGLAVKEAPLQTAATLAQTQTWTPRGMDVTAQARIQMNYDAQALAMTRAQYQRTPSEPLRAEMAQQAAKLQQDMQAYGQSRVADMQAAAQAREAAIPSTDPLRKARDALRTETNIYNYMTAHSERFTTQQLAQQLGGRNAARQAYNDTVYQRASDLASSQAALAQANARGDPGLVAAAQRTQGQTMLGLARNKPQTRTALAMIRGANTAANDAARQWADAQEALSTAQAKGDPELIAAAQRASGYADLSLAQNKYQREAALTKIQNASNASNDAARQWVDSKEAVAVAEAHGDAGLVAAAEKAAGYAELALAQNKFQRASAVAKIVAASNAENDAAIQWSDAQTALAVALAHGDAGVIAAAEKAGAYRDLGLAKNKFQREDALTKIAAANTAGIEAARATATSMTELQTARDYGNSVAQANDAIDGANRQLATAQTGAEKIAAQIQKINALNQKEQALADRFMSVGQLRASETLDPTKQISDMMDAAWKALEHTTGRDNRTKARTTYNQYKTQYEQSLINTREEDIKFQFDMMQIGSGEAVKRLQALLNLPGTTKAMRQSIQEEIRRFQLGLEQPIGGDGGFDLAPGNPRLPTFYDVQRAITGKMGNAPTHRLSVDASSAVNITINVDRNADVGQVADAIDRTTGSHLRQRLRAAGVR